VAAGLGAMALTLISAQAHAEVFTPPSDCAALQAKYPQFKGKTLVNAINPHTGLRDHRPEGPEQYIGFDVDLGETIGACLGFRSATSP
jgi:polar amino acid transport system substrate-binding protein